MIFQAKPFFDAVRTSLAGKLSLGQANGLNAVLTAMEGGALAHAAYALATAWHETGFTMQPIKERGGPDYLHKMYDPHSPLPRRAKMAVAHGNVTPGDGVRYCGRGYVQLTWRCNYEKAGKALGVDLIGDPDRAMDPVIAAKILRQGMDWGWFTGGKFSTFLPMKGPANRLQFERARKIINGTDKAAEIASHALKFQDALAAGGWA